MIQKNSILKDELQAFSNQNNELHSILSFVKKVNADIASSLASDSQKNKTPKSMDWGTQPGYEYQRTILSTLDSPFGKIENVLLDFPDFQTSVPHIHSVCGAETVISGQLLELQFSHNSTDYSYNSQRTISEGEQIWHFEEEGHPHAIRAINGPARVIATFCGAGSVKIIPKASINNLLSIPLPFPYLEGEEL